MAEYELIFGRNPVKEALRAGRNLNKILAASGETDHSLAAIVNQAKNKGINVQFTDRRKLDSLTGGQVHQGIVAYASPVMYVEVDDLLNAAVAKGEKPLLVMLDAITDPHNAGAIIRSAYCAGAHGVIFAKRRSAAVNETVNKSSAGAVSHIPVCQVSNLAQTVDLLKKKGIFAAAADKTGKDYAKTDFDLPLLLVIGAEGTGVSRLIKEKCDFSVTIPLKGSLDSLNASVAAGILLFQILQNRTSQTAAQK